MALMAGALYDALRAANVEHDVARRAAEAVVAHRTFGPKVDLVAVRNDVDTLLWMTGLALVLNLAILIRIFST